MRRPGLRSLREALRFRGGSDHVISCCVALVRASTRRSLRALQEASETAASPHVDSDDTEDHHKEKPMRKRGKALLEVDPVEVDAGADLLALARQYREDG